MAKKKKEIEFRQRIIQFWVYLGLCAALATATGFVLFSGVVDPQYEHYRRLQRVLFPFLIAGCGGVVAAASVVLFPKRLVLRKKMLSLYGLGGRVIGQLPYDNIREVRVHYKGDGEHPLELVGIDLIKESRDTWWRKGLFSRFSQTFDIELRDEWDKPPNVIVRLIKGRMEEFFEAVAQGK